MKETKDWYIIDYISGQEIKWSPEEIEATQVFSKRLVEEYLYNKECLQTRPQFHVRKSPSDEAKKEYPVDIAIFSSSSRAESDLVWLVECKKRTRKDGIEQLKLYMDMCSSVQRWVWFNGEEQINLQKTKRDGRMHYQEIDNIPREWQRIEDIGHHLRKQLRPAKDLKSHFKVIDNYLYGNMKKEDTSTRNRAKQIINLLFCKIYDELYTGQDEIVTFRAWIYEDKQEIADRMKRLFSEVKDRYNDVFDPEDTIQLDAWSISFFVSQIQELCITESERDVIWDAFEVFVSKALKWEEWQFFTPRNVIKMMVDIIDPQCDEKIIDPSCWTGWFLIESLKYVRWQIEKKWNQKWWKSWFIKEEKERTASVYFRWIDKDSFVAKVTKAYMAIIWDGRWWVFCENSLEDPKKEWSNKCNDMIQLWQFDVLLTNPPFGSKIPVSGEQILKQYEFWYKWKKDSEWRREKTNKLKDKEAPQILFIERCLALLKEWWRMWIVLPDGIYGNDNYGYIRQYLLEHTKILGIIDVPSETFQPNTSAKTTILFLRKNKIWDIIPNYNVFLWICDECGHDRRGKSKEQDDISLVADAYKDFIKKI